MFELSSSITQILKVFGLFFITAIAEILGCYFPYLILNQGSHIGCGYPQH
jgi:small multidrug resistance family-3 protein